MNYNRRRGFSTRVSTLILLQKHVLGHELGGHTVARKAWRMIVLILAQFNATLELGYRTGGTFVFRGTFAIAIGTNPVDCGTKTGLLFVHVTIEDEIVTLFLIAYKVVVHFLYPNILRQVRNKLTGCNGTEKKILELDWILLGSSSLNTFDANATKLLA